MLRVGGRKLEWSVLRDNEPSIRFYEKMGGVAGKEWLKMSVTGEELGKLARGEVGGKKGE